MNERKRSVVGEWVCSDVGVQEWWSNAAWMWTSVRSSGFISWWLWKVWWSPFPWSSRAGWAKQPNQTLLWVKQIMSSGYIPSLYVRNRLKPRHYALKNQTFSNVFRCFVCFTYYLCALQSETYQEDLFPMTAGTESALSAAEWLSGIDRGDVFIFMYLKEWMDKWTWSEFISPFSQTYFIGLSSF